MKRILHVALSLVVALPCLIRVDGRWNLGRLLSKQKVKPVVEEVAWHHRLIRKVRRRKLASATRQTKESWARKLSNRLQPNNKPNKEEARRKKTNLSKGKRKSPDFTPQMDAAKSTTDNKRRKANETSSTDTSCSAFKQTRNIWRRYRDAANADTAYRMAILSSLAYWEFDKRPTNMTSFRLQPDDKLKLKQKSLRRSAQVALCHVAAGVSNSNTIVEKHHNKQQTSKRQQSCHQVVSRKANSGHQYDFQWYLHDWHEPTPLAGKWHDTDLLVATSGDDTLVLSFAGTASAADAVTNVQTFEKASHAGLFNITEGSIHRGFLNAYSRVERGKVSRICREDSCNHQYNNLTNSLHHRYQHCYEEANEQHNNSTKKEKKRRKCKGRDERLMFILRELVTSALLAGNRVHLTGHSLGGGISTLFALDIILNFSSIPISKLHLWTFGAPQVADDVFLKSAMEASPRLRAYLSNKKGRRYHRYVTLSDKCRVDVVSTIASTTLASHKQGLHGRVARSLGGVRGRIIHMAEPHYLPPILMATNGTTAVAEEVPTKTGSTLGAHHITSYLQGISRESPSHPLMSNLPIEVADFIGEVQPKSVNTV